MRKTLVLLFFLPGMHLLRAQGNNPAHSRDIRVIGDTIIFHGTRLELDQQGFPGQIDSMLAENIHFHFTRQADGKDIRLKSEGIVFIRQQPARVEWRAINISDELKMELNAVLISDGLLSYTVKATALQDLELKEITMHIPVRPDSNYAWKKDTARANQTEVSVSTGHAGLHYLLHGSAWMNEGKGSTTVGIKGRSLLANNYSGAHNMKKGDTIEYDFDLYLLREANH